MAYGIARAAVNSPLLFHNYSVRPIINTSNLPNCQMEKRDTSCKIVNKEHVDYNTETVSLMTQIATKTKCSMLTISELHGTHGT